jgi:hypothetical protein
LFVLEMILPFFVGEQAPAEVLFILLLILLVLIKATRMLRGKMGPSKKPWKDADPRKAESLQKAEGSRKVETPLAAKKPRKLADHRKPVGAPKAEAPRKAEGSTA